LRVDYGHSNRSEATSHKSLEANTTSSERALPTRLEATDAVQARKWLTDKGFCVVFLKSFYRVDAE
jgi:hypothetical protein